MADNKGIFCVDCGTKWTGDKNCTNCGSKKKLFKIYITDTITVHDKMRLKQKRKGYNKPILESVFGDDLFRKTNIWTTLTRIVDRLKNNYEEIITDQRTGKIIKQVKEKLTDHIGHGSAKK